MLRVRAGAEVPRRSADRRRPSSAPSGWTGRAAPWSTRLPWPPSHEVRSRSLALLTLLGLRRPRRRGQPADSSTTA